jgi:hypothetical protein
MDLKAYYNPDILNQGTGFFCLSRDMSKWKNPILQHFSEPVHGGFDGQTLDRSFCIKAWVLRHNYCFYGQHLILDVDGTKSVPSITCYM